MTIDKLLLITLTITIFLPVLHIQFIIIMERTINYFYYKNLLY